MIDDITIYLLSTIYLLLWNVFAVSPLPRHYKGYVNSGVDVGRKFCVSPIAVDMISGDFLVVRVVFFGACVLVRLCSSLSYTQSYW